MLYVGFEVENREHSERFAWFKSQTELFSANNSVSRECGPGFEREKRERSERFA